jgi:exodeoxyribonuclease VII large subunit
MVIQYEQRVDDLSKSLATNVKHNIDMRQERFNNLGGKLAALNPLAILGRGYSVTVKLPEMSIIKDVSSLKKGDVVETKVGKGRFTSRVEDTKS